MLSLSFLNGLGYRFGNPERIVPFSPGLRPRSFRQPFTINTAQMVTMRHRRIDTPAQKERGSYPGLLPSGFSTPTGLRQISAAEPQPRWGSLSLVHIAFVPESIWD